MSRFIFLNLLELVSGTRIFCVKSEKIFDFFLNVGVDVIEIKDALFSSLSHFIQFQLSIVAFARAIPPRFLKDNSNSSFATTAKSNE